MTIRQKRAAQLVATGSNMAEVMVKAGYSPRTARAPGKLTKSKGWKQLLEKYMPDDKLLSVHNELLDSTQDQIRLGAVGLGYRVKGKLTPEVVNNNQFNIESMKIEIE